MIDKTDLAKQIARRCFKVSVYEATTDISQRLDDLDEQARMETFLNLRIAKWMKVSATGWGWVVAHAQDLGSLKIMGEFEAYVERHLVPEP